MNEMVDRVAAAIKLAWDKRPLYAGDIIEIDCAPLAKAAIEAMREPTKAMIETAIPLWSEYESFPSETPKAMWQAMIDEALK